MSIFDQPGGKQRLAEELCDAVHNTGFFSLINTGFNTDEVQRQYDIGQQYFALDPEDKGRPEHRCDFTQGNYFGYRAVSDRQCRRAEQSRARRTHSANLQKPHEKTIMGTDVLDNVESVNIAKFIPQYESEPFHPFFQSYRAEIEAFHRVCGICPMSHPSGLLEADRLHRNLSALPARSSRSFASFWSSQRTTSRPVIYTIRPARTTYAT